MENRPVSYTHLTLPTTALCLWHGSGASNFLYQFTLWGSIILTVYSGAVYCVGARKFLQR